MAQCARHGTFISFLNPGPHCARSPCEHTSGGPSTAESQEEFVQSFAPVTHASSGQRVASFLLSDDTQSSVPLLVVGAGLALAVAVIYGTKAVCWEINLPRG